MRLFLCLLVTLVFCGCQGSYTEMHYGAAVVTSPTANGQFHYLRFDEWKSTGSRDELPKVYVKVDNHPPFFLPELDTATAAKFFSEHARQKVTSPKGEEQDVVYFHSRTVYLQFVKDMPRYIVLGDGTRRVIDPGIKIGPAPDGPFFAFPLTREEVLQVLGPPDKEATNRHRFPT